MTVVDCEKFEAEIVVVVVTSDDEAIAAVMDVVDLIISVKCE